MARQVDFFDGAQSSTTPTIGNIVASNLTTYANDAAYEAAESGAPAEGNLYFNTTTKTIRHYNGTTWEDVLNEEGTQTLQNKTIDGTSATGNNTVSIDADDATFDNATSGLTATDVQAAIDEVEGRVDTSETDISNLETLSGSPGATDHGTFTGSTIPDNSTTKAALQSLETEVELKEDSANKGVVNGYASLDAGGKVPASQLPSTVMEYQGNWNANTNSPTLADGVGDTGDIYNTSVAGTQDLGSGNITFDVGDWVVYNGTIWERSINSDSVTPSNSVTLTNKTMDADNNTFSNFEHGSEVDDPSSGVHGVTGSVVGTTDAQVLTNKDYDGGTAANTRRITVPQDTKTNLDALTRKEGTLVYANDEDTLYVDDGSALQAVGSGSSNLSVRTENSAYTAVLSDDVILVDSSGGTFTVTLPTAVGNTGKVFTIKKIDTSYTIVTIDGDGSETIDGDSDTTVATENESLEIVSDGSNWEILERRIYSEWETFTPTGNWTTNTSYDGARRRVGDSWEFMIDVDLSGAPNSATFSITIPESLTIDGNRLPHGLGAGSENNMLGPVYLLDNSTQANRTGGYVYPANSTSVNILAEGGTTVTTTHPFTWGASDNVLMNFKVPITDWKG